MPLAQREASALGALTVLELAKGVGGEYCGKLLADFGATVIKLESQAAAVPPVVSGRLRPGLPRPRAAACSPG